MNTRRSVVTIQLLFFFLQSADTRQFFTTRMRERKKLGPSIQLYYTKPYLLSRGMRSQKSNKTWPRRKEPVVFALTPKCRLRERNRKSSLTSKYLINSVSHTLYAFEFSSTRSFACQFDLTCVIRRIRLLD